METDIMPPEIDLTAMPERRTYTTSYVSTASYWKDGKWNKYSEQAATATASWVNKIPRWNTDGTCYYCGGTGQDEDSGSGSCEPCEGWGHE